MALTLDEFLLLPDEKPALEYERGTVSQKLEPGARHGLIQGEMACLIEPRVRPDRSFFTLIEATVIWQDEDVCYVPDAIAYSRDRVPTDSEGYIADHLIVPPDVAVEVSAPGQSLDTQMDRCRWYVAHGVCLSLLIRLDQYTIWTFRPDTESGPFRDADVVDLDDVIPGFSFVVADLFAALRPRRA
jgi:Uma2 family endonuclease